MTHEEREIFLALIHEKMPQVKVHEKEGKTIEKHISNQSICGIIL